MVQRLTYRRRHPWKTASNSTRVYHCSGTCLVVWSYCRYCRLKTPGGKITVQYRTKAANGPRCGDCGNSIQGVRDFSFQINLIVLIAHSPGNLSFPGPSPPPT